MACCCLWNVRKLYTCDGKSDKMIAGQKNGQSFPLAHVGYARVSTLDQDPTLQHDALTTAGCTKIFEDRASGARADRPGLRKALDYAREGDELIDPGRNSRVRLQRVYLAKRCSRREGRDQFLAGKLSAPTKPTSSRLSHSQTLWL